MNQNDDQLEGATASKQRNGQLTFGSHEVQIDKDDFFVQMKNKVELLKNEKRRLLIEIERTVKENVDLKTQKQKIIDTTKEIIESIKESNDGLVKMVEEKQTEIDNVRRDLADRNMTINKLKEKLTES